MKVVVTGAPHSGAGPLVRAMRAAWVPSADNDGDLLDRRVDELDARLLVRLGWSGGALPAEPPIAPPADPAAVEEGRSLISGPAPDVLAGATIGVLLPWWRRILDDRCVLVVPVADPRQVAWRGALEGDGEAGLELARWLGWHRHLAAGAAGLPVVLVDMDRLEADPAGILDRLASSLARLHLSVPEGAAERAAGAWRTDAGGRAPIDPATEDLAAGARALVAAWLTEPVVAMAHADLVAPAPEAWERAVLDVGRRLAVTGSLRAAERTAASALEGELLAARAHIEELELSQGHLEDVEARLAATQQDARHREAMLVALRQESDAVRLQADQLAELERARRAQLSDASDRERVLATAHLQLQASVTGRFAARWARLAQRRRVVGASDRVVATVAQGIAIRRFQVVRRHPLFDASWYLEHNADVRDLGANPYRHYRRHGSREGRRPNAFLDPDWYRARNPDVVASGLDPIDHYHAYGWREGRDPGPGFDTRWYLAGNPDVLVMGVDPLEHFLRSGRAEGRSPAPSSAFEGALSRGPELLERPALVTAADRAEGHPEASVRSDRAWREDVMAALSALPTRARPRVLADRAERLPVVSGRAAAWLVPAPGGADGGRFPASGRSAVVQLESARHDGADHLVIHRDDAWWLDRHPDLARHLDRYRRVPLGGAAVLAWRLTPTASPRQEAADELLSRVRRTVGRDLAALVWGVPVEGMAARIGGTLFVPPGEDRTLPYLDASIDVVVIGTDDAETLAEAMRVASQAVLRVDGDRMDLQPAWVTPALTTPSRVAVALLGTPERSVSNDDVSAVLDGLGDGPVEALLVVTDAPTTITVVARRPDLPPVRTVPIAAGASVSARAAAAAGATSAELIALLDGRVTPIPGWLPVLTASLEGDAATDGVAPLLVCPDGLVAGPDPRDVGDARMQAVRATDAVSTAAVMVRGSDLLADAPGDGRRAVEISADGRTIRFGRSGRIEPAAMAIVRPDAEVLGG